MSCTALQAEFIGGYRNARLGGQKYVQYDLDRSDAHLSLTWRNSPRMEGGVVVGAEAIRSAGPQSLMGIDGDSILIRMLHAYGHGKMQFKPLDVGARFGLVPERWLEQIGKGYDARGIDALMSDRLFFYRSDLGATLTLSAWQGLVEVDISYVNGEGQAQREQNTGKNTSAMLSMRPLMMDSPSGPVKVAIHIAYRDGSLGIASTKNHRFASAATLESPWAYAGAEYIHAMGFDGQAGRNANSLSGWVSGHLLSPLGLSLKYDRVRQDLDEPASTLDRITTGAFIDGFPHQERTSRRLRLYVAYQQETYGIQAGPMPGAPEASQTQALLVQVHASGLHPFHL